MNRAGRILMALVLSCTGPTLAPAQPPIRSVTVTLTKSTLLPGEKTTARAYPRRANGSIATAQITWKTSDGAIASVDPYGVVMVNITATGAGQVAINATVVGTNITGGAIVTVAPIPPPPAPPVPPAPIPTPLPINTGLDSTTLAKVVAFSGPSADSLVPDWYKLLRKTQADIQWTACGPAWDCGNSISAYNRSAMFNMLWLSSNDTTWKTHAHALVQNYEAGYMKNNTVMPSPHWSQSESLALDCWITHDPIDCDGVGYVANGFTVFLLGKPWGMGFPDSEVAYMARISHPDADSRIQARVIETMRAAEAIAGPGTVYSTYLDTAVALALSSFNSKGWAPWTSQCGGNLNYMSGLVADQLTRVHDQRPRAQYNVKIETSMLALGNYLWADQWRPIDLSFNYNSVLCLLTGSPTAAPDLNGLMLPLFGWLGKMTGDPIWFVRGDSIALGIKQASVYLYRQYSETFGSSFRYWGYKAQYQPGVSRMSPGVMTSRTSRTTRTMRPPPSTQRKSPARAKQKP